MKIRTVFVAHPETDHMKFMEFAVLPASEQLHRIRLDGVYVGKRLADGKTLLLYQYDSFYIEIRYSSYRRIAESLVVTEDAAILNPYISQVEVSFLPKKPLEWPGHSGPIF